MDEKLQSPDKWWAGLQARERIFFRDLMRCADELLDGEVLKVSCDGSSSVPELKGRRGRGRPSEAVGGTPLAVEADEWWTRLSAEFRKFVRAINGFVLQLARHRDECLEIINTGGRIQVTLVMMLEQPVMAGRPERN
jgi:hypothetical protein